MQELTSKHNNIIADACNIVETARQSAYQSVNVLLIKRNWLLGKRIAEEEQIGNLRSEYGLKIITDLSNTLSERYGKGFDRSSLYKYVKFYQTFPEIVDSVSPQSLLSWTHYRVLLQVDDNEARNWYANEASKEVWSVRTLQRNISSQYYYRILKSQKKELVHSEMKQLTAPMQDKLEYLKNPVVAEFLGFTNNSVYSESDLEQQILNHLSQFMVELGKGFAFVGRQKRIHTEKHDYYIDLVFYNYKLKCFVLVDLKTDKLDYQDVGQMDMYVKMFDENQKEPDDNPTIGLLLCADTDEDVAKYSVLNGNEQLFAAKYLTYMPTQEELKREIQQQKIMFELQNSDK